jgi:hypothetical protein
MSDTQNVSTFRASPQDIVRFKQALVGMGLASRSHFFRVATMRFIEQVEADQIPDWPPEFVPRPSPRKKQRTKRKST